MYVHMHLIQFARPSSALVGFQQLARREQVEQSNTLLSIISLDVPGPGAYDMSSRSIALKLA